MRHDPASIFLYRPVNQQELDLIAATGWTAFPLRRPEQSVFYPVLNETYAAEIAHGWDAPAAGVGYVLRFAIDADYANTFPVQNVGGQDYDELWVPAEELAEFNSYIVGQIEVVGVFKAD